RVGRASVWESPYGVGTDLPQEGSGRRDPGDRDVIRHWNRRAGYRDVQHIDIVGSKDGVGRRIPIGYTTQFIGMSGSVVGIGRILAVPPGRNCLFHALQSG